MYVRRSDVVRYLEGRTSAGEALRANWLATHRPSVSLDVYSHVMPSDEVTSERFLSPQRRREAVERPSIRVSIAGPMNVRGKGAGMAGVEVGDFNAPDETRTPDKTTIEIVRMGGSTASRMRLEPGWRWSECIKPIVGGERCQALHLGLLQSGSMHVVHDDGSEQEIGPGQTDVIEPGHDAWVVGDEPVVGFEFQSRTAEEYAKG